MKHFLLSFIGTGNYKETTYQFGNHSCKTDFFYQAAQQFLTPDHTILAMTKESIHKHTKIIKEDQDNVDIIEIPTGGNESEIWDAFKLIADIIPWGSKLSIDITHGFRFQPLMSLAHLLYLQAVKDVSPGSILYGAYMEDELSEVIDLTPFLTIIDWSYGVMSLSKFGLFNPVANIISNTNTELWTKAYSASSKPKHLLKLGKALTEIGISLEINHLKETAFAAKKINKVIPEVKKESNDIKQLSPLIDILNIINNKAKDLTPSDENGRPKPSELINHLLYSGQFQQAITVCREYMLMHFADQASNLGVENIENLLNAHVRSPDQFDHQIKECLIIWGQLRDLRNMVNHAFVGKEDPNAVRMQKNIVEICEKCIDWFNKADPSISKNWIINMPPQ